MVSKDKWPPKSDFGGHREKAEKQTVTEQWPAWPPKSLLNKKCICIIPCSILHVIIQTVFLFIGKNVAMLAITAVSC